LVDGWIENKYSADLIDNVLTMDDLFN